MNRSLISVASLFLPEQKGRELERLRPGKEEYRRLQLADYVFVSFGKRGRTWLRVMLSRCYHEPTMRRPPPTPARDWPANQRLG